MNTTPQPVTLWENDDVKGHALCAEYIFREDVERAQTFRERQSSYLASLPVDRKTAIEAALKTMHPKGETYLEGFENALHLSFALLALIKEGDLDADGRSRDSALYIADRLTTDLHFTARKLDHLSFILRNPARVEQGAKNGGATPPGTKREDAEV